MNATVEPKRRFRKRWLWASLNVAGMVLYLRAGSVLWVVAGDEGTPGGAGDAFYFFFAVVPILVAFLLLDLAALRWIFFRTSRSNRAAALAVWSAVLALWGGVVAFDHHKSFREVIEARYGWNPDRPAPSLGHRHRRLPAASRVDDFDSKHSRCSDPAVHQIALGQDRVH